VIDECDKVVENSVTGEIFPYDLVYTAVPSNADRANTTTQKCIGTLKLHSNGPSYSKYGDWYTGR